MNALVDAKYKCQCTAPPQLDKESGITHWENGADGNLHSVPNGAFAFQICQRQRPEAVRKEFREGIFSSRQSPKVRENRGSQDL